MVRGKGDKERIVPLCDDAIYWIELYINTKRKEKILKENAPLSFIRQGNSSYVKNCLLVSY